MRATVLTLALVMASPAAPAWADMAGAFGNTIVSHYPDGGTVRHYFDADGAYRARFSDGRTLSGRWAERNGRVCLDGIRPRILMIDSFCTDMVDARVGESWQARDPIGRRVRNELVRGR